ncbi:MAG: DUF4827 domain-containing protein [Bacteroidaceae bacterium]|nr:DUF4827 domain-containing protein [Bacteroidaceae bacterium]
MKKLSILLMVVCGLGFTFLSCNDGKTYAELKEEEREAIKRFIELNEIKVIDEKQFEDQDSTTNVAANEYVLFDESGVYMQVIERGKGELLEEGRHEILVRYVEEQIADDGTTDTLSLNTIPNLYAHPDDFILTKQGNSLSASFGANGAMYQTHSSAYVPSGWLLPLNYLKVGREISGRSKIRLILPHSQGTATASGQVFPCYYEITYQLSR